MTVKVEVYSTTYCPFCRAAERMLDSKGVKHEVFDVTHDPEKRQWLVQTTGMTTVPQIFINDQAIGGFTDMRTLEQEGKLDQMLGIA